MQIKQFENKHLSHFSYAILSNCEKKIILIDPARDPQQYIDYASENDAQISGIIETHPHADFISSHLELHQSLGVPIYAGKIVDATYPYQSFDEGQVIKLGKIKLTALNTPGHSPDSICIVLEHDAEQKAVFTGDTLFIGDCGRPDLRPDESDAASAADNLARKMYHSLRNKLMPIDHAAIVYPAHGAGTLCGKVLSKAHSSTIGEEKKTNWCLQPQTEDEFVKQLLNEQPFVPAYFPFDVALNKKGATAFEASVTGVKIGDAITNENLAEQLNSSIWIIDVRDEAIYKKGHLPYSINLMNETKFETWLGSIIKPDEQFYLTAKDEKILKNTIKRIAAIGYEKQIKSAFILQFNKIVQDELDVDKFKLHSNNYTIIDVRNASEVKEKKIFANSISIPLRELRENIDKVPLDKPIVVHCASGFRSAAGSSLLQSVLKGTVTVFDLGETIKDFL